MYYYIFQSVGAKNVKKLYEKIKLRISLSGISGEIVQTTPLRTIEEMTELGITKGYHTIVAVGTDEFINKVAHFLINLSLAQNRDKIVFGAIPLNYQDSLMAQLLNVSTVDEAIENLKNRHLRKIDVAFIEPNKFFILPIEISKNKPFFTMITTKNYCAKSLVDKVKITPSLKLMLKDIGIGNGFLSKVVSFFKIERPQNHYSTRFSSKTFSIESNELIPVKIGEEVLAKTPVRLHTIPKLLHLIMPRVRIN
ncbi:MAG: Diacylglycerol kinase catalytic region [Candidatus Berkelbacteria bacterium Licking1014_7]|uniref:Diacylglycerol kinase catalytic region n=1 Tax=Candidatus Berkelbacteria bacterium Licking1014_7 TaxID=2017147 RepID=A0A554LKN5_9BACT|nr:MAG: Diacylglycerol kinase catalytic region [Candidatus Berkelbacteria bacterium Licking1014_7]